MPKFFLSPESIHGGQIRLGENNTAHLRAFRLRSGEKMTVSDGNGWEYLCVFRGIVDGEGYADILSRSACQTEPSLKVHIFAALPKGDKAEHILQKAVELGAADVCFFLSSRCVSRPDTAAAGKRLERLRRVSEEAAMQSGRGIVPEVSWTPIYREMLARASSADISLFLWEEATESSLMSAMRSYSGCPGSVSLVTGPEGGFSREEAELSESFGLVSVTLGKRILRCETAPLCALSAVMYETGNLE